MIFQHFISIFQNFSRSGILLCKFQDFFNNSRLYASPEQQKLRAVAEFPGKIKERRKSSVDRLLFLLLFCF